MAPALDLPMTGRGRARRPRNKQAVTFEIRCEDNKSLRVERLEELRVDNDAGTAIDFRGRDAQFGIEPASAFRSPLRRRQSSAAMTNSLSVAIRRLSAHASPCAANCADRKQRTPPFWLLRNGAGSLPGSPR